MKLDFNLIESKPSSSDAALSDSNALKHTVAHDVQINGGTWEYTAKNVREALGLICRGDGALAERLISKAREEVNRVRVKFDGRSVSHKEVQAISGPPKGSGEVMARQYVIMTQEEMHR
jgi:hypothetical protein